MIAPVQSGNSVGSGKGLQAFVVLTGIFVFVLLFFADKTQLKNPERGLETVNSEEQVRVDHPSSGGSSLESLVNSGSDSPEIKTLKSRLEVEKAEGKPQVLQEIVEKLRDESKLDQAAVYAAKLADLVPEAKNCLVAGALFRTTSEGFHADGDSVRFLAFSEKAIEYLKKADVLKPNDEAIMIELGLTMVGSGIPENSMLGIQKLVKVLEINPANEEAAYQLGVFSLQTGQYEKAESRFRKVIELNPKNLQAKLLLGGALRETGKVKEAKVIFEELAKQQRDTEIASMAAEMLSELKNK